MQEWLRCEAQELAFSGKSIRQSISLTQIWLENVMNVSIFFDVAHLQDFV